MRPLITLLLLTFLCTSGRAQLSPAITSWLQNNSETGTYYVEGNPTLIENDILVNCQKVEYSDDFVYVSATGVPAYPTGPFPDGNPSQATNQDGIYKIPLNPVQNTGTPDATVGGNIGIFINGVALFDYRDGVAWNPNTNTICGGPGNPPCPGGPVAQQDWNRDAIPAEREGFDCSKGHPAMGNYHHHQNPSAFKLDLEVTSTICNLYDAEGLYAIDSTRHSPLIGFAYDGYPIYGAYGYKNSDGTGGIVRIKSSYTLRDITERTEHADGTDVSDGPPVSDTYFLGYFREDYAYNAPAAADQDYLDEHNGRFCVTPEYPDGTYAYFATVDENWVSAYPYAVGPTFAGEYENRSVNSVNETTTVYNGTTSVSGFADDANITVFPNPAADLIAVQLPGLVDHDFTVQLINADGKLVREKFIRSGQTIAYFDTQTFYRGVYFVRISSADSEVTRKVIVE
ncbi:YHYH protein [Neolewinella aurantiaca]|uniref:YHYH protein n=1 Tax=Neolewinella aurantiaca TaxID=2602767 RepID=A0A5C7FK82_9BACT|nr:YHYH protein [Neolewinella aurantiaca]TXF90323.1 YHYH protein [Neolewinella aurantiaca]